MPDHRRSAGLKPIEVLVLGSAVVVGVALLGLWTWQRSREEARAAQCRTVLERYGRAFEAYAVDFGEVLPYENVGREGEGHVCWFHALEVYRGDVNRICPSVDRAVENHVEGYRMNSQLVRGGALPSDRYRRLDSIPRPDATVILFDAEYGGRKHSMKGKLKDVDYRHNGSANLLFVDWHVERFERTALDEASSWLPPRVVWNPDAEAPGNEATGEEP